MTIRLKISLLITLAGFVASLVFSFIILWEMSEQPYQIIDSELESMGMRMVENVNKGDKSIIHETSQYIDDEKYWLKVSDWDTGESIYQSKMADLIDIPERKPGFSNTVSLNISKEIIDFDQNRHNEVNFRVKSFIIDLGGQTYLVSIAHTMEDLEDELFDIFVGVASGLAVSVLLLGIISYFVAGIILNPFKIINNQARDITEKNLSRRIPISGKKDEFNELALTLNHVFDRLQHAFIRQKQLLADASHELKTPLTMMRLSLDEMVSTQDTDLPETRAGVLARMTDQVLRMDRLIKNILDLSSIEIEDIKTENAVDVSKILDFLISDYRYLADTRHIQINAHIPQNLIMIGNSDKLTRAFSNILDNAIKYNIDNGWVEVNGSQSETEIKITISNTGPGVSENDINKVFEQFYRVEQSRSLKYGGSGLGLAIVKRIFERHEGKVKFESQPDEWTKVTVCLPLRLKIISEREQQ